MKKHIILGIVLVLVTTGLALFIKFHPFQRKQEIAFQDEMTLRHISERNDMPIEDILLVLPIEDRDSLRSTFMNLHKPIKDLNVNRDEIKKAIRKIRFIFSPYKIPFCNV